jgi:hypothetical protein
MVYVGEGFPGKLLRNSVNRHPKGLVRNKGLEGILQQMGAPEPEQVLLCTPVQLG